MSGCRISNTATERDARKCSAPADYTQQALESIAGMIRQTGERLETMGGIARQGVIIRHLVMPGRVQNSLDVIRLIAAHLSKKVPMSLMSQYTPTPAVTDDPLMGRRVTREEYEAVVDLALELEFENLFIQEVDEQSLTPDFNKADPFSWEQSSKDPSIMHQGFQSDGFLNTLLLVACCLSLHDKVSPYAFLHL